MEGERKKRYALLLGSIVVAVMFITSYAAFANNGSVPTSTTTIQETTYYVTGQANALVTGYSSTLTVYTSNNSTASQMQSLLSSMESNGSISNYLTAGNQYILYTTGMTPYAAQQAITGSLPANSVAINGTERVQLPQSVSTSYYGKAVTIYPSVLNFTISTPMLLPVGASASVTVHALVLGNGQVYDSNIQVYGG